MEPSVPRALGRCGMSPPLRAPAGFPGLASNPAAGCQRAVSRPSRRHRELPAMPSARSSRLANARSVRTGLFQATVCGATAALFAGESRRSSRPAADIDRGTMRSVPARKGQRAQFRLSLPLEYG